MFLRRTSGEAPAKTSEISYIGPDAVVSGNFSTIGQLHVDGRIEGNVSCGALRQGSSGIIAGNVRAEVAHLAGTVDGQVDGATIELEGTARVTGDVSYDIITMAAGAAVEGRLARRQALRSAVPEEPTVLIATPTGEEEPQPVATSDLFARQARRRGNALRG